MSVTDPIKTMRRLRDAAVENLMATTEEELRKECEEDGEDFDDIAAKARATINAAIQKARSNQP